MPSCQVTLQILPSCVVGVRSVWLTEEEAKVQKDSITCPSYAVGELGYQAPFGFSYRAPVISIFKFWFLPPNGFIGWYRQSNLKDNLHLKNCPLWKRQKTFWFTYFVSILFVKLKFQDFWFIPAFVQIFRFVWQENVNFKSKAWALIKDPYFWF